MKVRCISLKEISDGAWLTEGKEYIVLSIFIDNRKKMMFRLIGDDGRVPAIYDSQLFSITSSKIPPNWILNSDDKGYIELAPASWTQLGFWEEYFDRESKAEMIFEIEKKIIENSEI